MPGISVNSPELRQRGGGGPSGGVRRTSPGCGELLAYLAILSGAGGSVYLIFFAKDVSQAENGEAEESAECVRASFEIPYGGMPVPLEFEGFNEKTMLTVTVPHGGKEIYLDHGAEEQIIPFAEERLTVTMQTSDNGYVGEVIFWRSTRAGGEAVIEGETASDGCRKSSIGLPRYALR